MNHARSEDDEEEERGHNQMNAITKRSETSHRHRVNENGTPANSGVHSTKGSQQFTIPTLHIEEADTDTEMANLRKFPKLKYQMSMKMNFGVNRKRKTRRTKTTRRHHCSLCKAKTAIQGLYTVSRRFQNCWKIFLKLASNLPNPKVSNSCSWVTVIN